MTLLLATFTVNAQNNLYSFASKANCTVHIDMYICGNSTSMSIDVNPNSDVSFTLINQFPQTIKARFDGDYVVYYDLTSACGPGATYMPSISPDPCYTTNAVFITTYTAYPPYDNQFSFAVY